MIEITSLIEVTKHLHDLKAVIFDLDDTLYSEKEYIRSGYRAIASKMPEVKQMLETVPRFELNKKISDVVEKIKPDEVYIPHRGDMQLDHQYVVDAAMVAVRPRGKNYPKRVYSYETLSETGWNIPNTVNEFIPTVYENITETFELKLSSMNVFKSQLALFPAARSIGAIEVLAKFRGATVSVEAAEAFSLIREVK